MDTRLDDKYLKIIESVAATAVYQVDGVASLTQQSGEIEMRREVGKKARRSVIAYDDGGRVVVDISINVYSGYSIPELACSVQQRVISEIQKTITVTVKAVNINVIGIVFKQ